MGFRQKNGAIRAQSADKNNSKQKKILLSAQKWDGKEILLGKFDFFYSSEDFRIAKVKELNETVKVID